MCRVGWRAARKLRVAQQEGAHIPHCVAPPYTRLHLHFSLAREPRASGLGLWRVYSTLLVLWGWGYLYYGYGFWREICPLDTDYYLNQKIPPGILLGFSSSSNWIKKFNGHARHTARLHGEILRIARFASMPPPPFCTQRIKRSSVRTSYFYGRIRPLSI